jgi:hypothetical protein
MWLQDAGLPVFNCSQGMDFVFAPWFAPEALHAELGRW